MNHITRNETSFIEQGGFSWGFVDRDFLNSCSVKWCRNTQKPTTAKLTGLVESTIEAESGTWQREGTQRRLWKGIRMRETNSLKFRKNILCFWCLLSIAFSSIMTAGLKDCQPLSASVISPNPILLYILRWDQNWVMIAKGNTDSRGEHLKKKLW